jgi:hypothetical protein
MSEVSPTPPASTIPSERTIHRIAAMAENHHGRLKSTGGPQMCHQHLKKFLLTYA